MTEGPGTPTIPTGPLHVLVLASRRSDNPYGDTEETYVFPRSYLSRFEPLTRGEGMLALIYEPRRGGGRQEYVAWGWLSTPPVNRLDGQFEVSYDGRILPLPRPCPLVGPGGVPFEARLRAVLPERRGGALQGASVRTLDILDALAILNFSGQVGLLSEEPQTPERAVQLVRRSVRDRGFRAQVLAAYGYRCAVTGFAAPADEARALLDAAHVQPVAARGGDHVGNGLSLISVVHRFYDEGLITFEPAAGAVRLLTSRRLSAVTLTGQGGTLRLDDGQPLLLPADPRAWPDPVALAWHRRHVFSA